MELGSIACNNAQKAFLDKEVKIRTGPVFETAIQQNMGHRRSILDPRKSSRDAISDPLAQSLDKFATFTSSTKK